MIKPPAGINPFGPSLYKQRPRIERSFAQLVSYGGLNSLPPWVRRIWRVRSWVMAKLPINAAASESKGVARHDA